MSAVGRCLDDFGPGASPSTCILRAEPKTVDHDSGLLLPGDVWACSEPEKPAHIGTCWWDDCPACRLAYAVAAADGSAFLSHQRIGQFMQAMELAERYDDDRMRRVLAAR